MPTKPKVKFETPPDAKRGPGGGKYAPFFDVLRENPGEFAVWPGPASSASAIKNGKYTGAEEGEFEVVTRTVDGELKAWVAFSG